MGYSKITTIEVVNFMSYKYAKVLFDESGMINIKGYNDSGKSALLKSAIVCFTNMYARDQLKFIHHGEDYFRIIISFDDGVKILRDKYLNGQSLYEMYKNGECIYTTKEGNKLTRVDDVPSVIATYLGLCVLENGCLNYQTRDDPLWLVQTKGSENYNDLNEILKTVEFAKANQLINSDKNKLSAEITEVEAELQKSRILLNNCKDISEEFLIALTEKESFNQALWGKYERVQEVHETLCELDSLQDIPEVQYIDSTKLRDITEIQRLLLEIEKISIPPEVSKVEFRRYSDITDLSKVLEDYERILKRSIPEVSSIETGKLKALKSIKETIDSLFSLNEDLNNSKREESKLRKEYTALIKDAEARGVFYVKCNNCGSYVEVES